MCCLILVKEVVVQYIHARKDIAKEVLRKLIEDGVDIHEKWDGWFS